MLPSDAPFDAASTTLTEPSFPNSILSSKAFASLSGNIILAIISPAGAAIKLAEIRYSSGIPISEYPTKTEPETEATPPTITVNNSDVDSLLIYGFIKRGDSVCDKNIFAAADKVSSLDVPRSLAKAPPIIFTINCIIPK